MFHFLIFLHIKFFLHSFYYSNNILSHFHLIHYFSIYHHIYLYYYILKSKNINNINEIFNCYELKDLFYLGNYKNNKKEGKGILYINNDNYKKIYEGNFKEDLKDGFGKIYYETGSIFESYWKEDNIDEEKESIFCLNKEIKYKKNKLNMIEWNKFINMEILKYYGNKSKEFKEQNHR